MEHSFLGLSNKKIPGATEHLKRQSFFFQMEYIYSKRIIHIWYQFQVFAAVFPVNGTDLYKR